MLRTECLTKFLNPPGTGRVGAVITYPEAIFEKVVLPKTLAENIISFKQGENINVDNILSKFIFHGFTRTDFVYEPGQFAVRGGILDIYSFGNERPYRIELFGKKFWYPSFMSELTLEEQLQEALKTAAASKKALADAQAK